MLGSTINVLCLEERVKRKRAGAGKCKEELVTTLCTSTRLFLHQLRSNRRPFSSAVSNTIISADIILQNSCPIQKKMTRQHKRLKLLLGVRKPTSIVVTYLYNTKMVPSFNYINTVVYPHLK